MKTTIFGFVAFTALGAVLVGSRPATIAAAQEQPKAEALPDFPMINAKNRQVPLTPDKKTIIAEMSGEGKESKVVRIGIACEVCLREGPLEQFLCKKGTKEHEAIVRVDLDAELVHLAIIAAGGKPGTPTGFVDPKTEQAKYTRGHRRRGRRPRSLQEGGQTPHAPGAGMDLGYQEEGTDCLHLGLRRQRVHQRPVQPERQAVLRGQ